MVAGVQARVCLCVCVWECLLVRDCRRCMEAAGKEGEKDDKHGRLGHEQRHLVSSFPLLP